MKRIARRMGEIAAFRVMEILGRSRDLEAQGRDIVHMEIGEPDFVSPKPIIDAGRQALADGCTHYTPAAGLPVLRESIAGYYRQRFGVDIEPRRILITPGASGALQLVLGVLVNPGDRVAVTDPGYPCNRHMIAAYGGIPVGLPVNSSNNFTVTSEALATAQADGLSALMLASPANPTGNTINLGQLQQLQSQLSRRSGAVLVCDEIYQGLQYGETPATALALGNDDIVVINSFSKYFGMTGWRVGWVVAPEWMIEPMERLAQNIFLASPTVAQHAAIAAFSEETLDVLEQRRYLFEQRRDLLYEAVTSLGFGVPNRPSGAFYLYADASKMSDDSLTFCRGLLEHAGVAITPGADFGHQLASQHVRFAYTTGEGRLAEGVERIARFLRAGA